MYRTHIKPIVKNFQKIQAHLVCQIKQQLCFCFVFLHHISMIVHGAKPKLIPSVKDRVT